MVDPKMEDGPQVIPMAAALETEPVSRLSSVSTQESAHHGLSQQPQGVPALAVSSTVTSPPQPRPVAIAPAMYASGTSPASTAPAPGGNLPRCENCDTSTTPLWRRDQSGAVLCNACGLFLKLHGRARPKTLKTDVIKSRNRVKTIRPDLAKQKKAQAQAHSNLGQPGDLNGADINGANGARRASQKSANGAMDDTHSPISRTGTPSLYASHMAPMYQNLEDQFQAQQLSGFGAPDGRAQSPLNGERLDIPQTHEQILATNASLKTRVSELEVIQELYRGRIQQLEQEEASRQAQDQNNSEAEVKLRAQVDAMTEAHNQLQKELEESHRRENMLKRRLDELEVELKDAKESLEVHESGRAKKARIEEAATNTDEAASTPQSAS